MPQTYYDVPMLKPPVWSPEVSAYFFLGGLSGGAYLLSRAASQVAIRRSGAVVAALAALPCAPLLVADLGDWSRFHHMMRVFKPSTPMNLGTWVLTAYSGIATLNALLPGPQNLALRAVSDLAGIPLALLLTTYTGVLLSCTTAPAWCQNGWLPVLFASGAFNNGCSAIQLALELTGQSAEADALDPIGTSATLLEAGAMAGYLSSVLDVSKAPRQGIAGMLLLGGGLGCGMVIPALLKRLLPRTRATRIATHLIELVGGACVRFGVLAAGRQSANDPDAARRASALRDGVRRDSLGDGNRAATGAPRSLEQPRRMASPSAEPSPVP